MGKKLTAQEISALIACLPHSQMFDVCCKCGGTEPYMDMNDTGDPSNFEVICDECLEKVK